MVSFNHCNTTLMCTALVFVFWGFRDPSASVSLCCFRSDLFCNKSKGWPRSPLRSQHKIKLDLCFESYTLLWRLLSVVLPLLVLIVDVTYTCSPLLVFLSCLSFYINNSSITITNDADCKSSSQTLALAQDWWSILLLRVLQSDVKMVE